MNPFHLILCEGRENRTMDLCLIEELLAKRDDFEADVLTFAILKILRLEAIGQFYPETSGQSHTIIALHMRCLVDL